MVAGFNQVFLTAMFASSLRVEGVETGQHCTNYVGHRVTPTFSQDATMSVIRMMSSSSKVSKIGTSALIPHGSVVPVGRAQLAHLAKSTTASISCTCRTNSKRLVRVRLELQDSGPCSTFGLWTSLVCDTTVKQLRIPPSPTPHPKAQTHRDHL